MLILAAISMAACDDDLGLQNWDATPDTISLFSLSRPELIGLPAGYDFATGRPVEVESPGAGGNWDVALAGTTSLELIPATGFEGQGSLRAAIAPIHGTTFEALDEAPGDTAAFTIEPVAVTPGGVYVVRSRRIACGFRTAVHYSKIQAVTVDPAAGKATFAVVINPLCNDRSFVPPN